MNRLRYCVCCLALAAILLGERCDFPRLDQHALPDASSPAVLPFTVPPGRWEPASLSQAYSEALVGVAHPSYVLVANGQVEDRVPLGEFMAGMPFQTDDNRSVIFEAGDLMAKAEMLADVAPPSQFQARFRAGAYQPIISIGGSGQGLTFHMHPASFLKLLWGKKLWLVYPPGATPTQLTEWHGLSSSDLDDLISALPVAQQPMRCWQSPGEMLYLPDGFLHATINLADITIAIGGQAFDNTATTLVAEAATTANHGDVRAWLYLAGQGNTTAMERAVKLCPGCIEPYLELAKEFATVQSDAQSAARELRRALVVAERGEGMASNLQANLLFRIGWFALLVEDFELASQALEASHKLNPAAPFTIAGQSICAFELGRHGQAAKLIKGLKKKQIMSFRPEVREATKSLISALREEGLLKRSKRQDL